MLFTKQMSLMYMYSHERKDILVLCVQTEIPHNHMSVFMTITVHSSVYFLRA